jgi:PEP-CTERM motif
MKKVILGLLLLLACMPLGATTFYSSYTDVTFSQTGGPFITAGASGFNTWVTPEQSTNLGSSTENIWFVWLGAQTGAGVMTWDNALQQFEGTSTTGELQTAAQANASFYLSLDSSSTDMPIPFPLTTSDSMPAFFVGTVAPGQTVNWNVDQTLSSNIYYFLYDGLFVATPAPEPASLPLFGAGLGLLGMFRRKLLG